MNKSLWVIILILPLFLLSQENQTEDPWGYLRFLEGTWEGIGEGMSGTSTVTQEYRFVLNRQFLCMATKSVFKPQEKNPKGEIHEDFGIFSFDRSRKTFVLRSFYVEGFVNQYVFNPSSEDRDTMEFITESVENAPPRTKAKLVFKKISEDEIEQSFFVAFSGREYSCFSTNTLKKKNQKQKRTIWQKKQKSNRNSSDIVRPRPTLIALW